jgi:hypothetical protein
VKLYGARGHPGHYSPPKLIGIHPEKINGEPKAEDFQELREAPEPDDANVDAALHPATNGA